MASDTEIRSASHSALRRFWMRTRSGFSAENLGVRVLALLIAGYVSLVWRTNRMTAEDRLRSRAVRAAFGPHILTVWHGQHYIATACLPRDVENVIMVSKSADAELNDRVLRRFGVSTIRASGGRDRTRTIEKGGIRGLLMMRDALQRGATVGMVADVPKGKSRDAGMGIILLARISGRPIVPAAYETTWRHVFAGAWDRSVLNFPFGRAALKTGAAIVVPADADESMMEEKRLELNRELERAHNQVKVALGINP